MPHIPFTQYKQPNGQMVSIVVDRPEPIATKAAKIIEAGHRFECEVLLTGEVSLTITDGENDVAIEICQNGPDVPVAIDRLIDNFNQI